jgi:hypothetical protein
MLLVSTICMTAQKIYHLMGDEDGKNAFLCMHSATFYYVRTRGKSALTIPTRASATTTSLQGRACPR